MTIFIIVLIAIILILFTIVNLITINTVKNLLNKDLLKVVSEINDDDFTREYKVIFDWAEKNNYKHHSFFLAYFVITPEPLKCAAWWSENEKTWLLFYFHKIKNNKNISIDFYTTYNNEFSITTSSNKDALSLPRPPKALIQAFNNLSLDDLHKKHQAAREILEKLPIIKPIKIKSDIVYEIGDFINEQGRFIMSLPFWKFKGIYWFFVKAKLEGNKPISKDMVEKLINKTNS